MAIVFIVGHVQSKDIENEEITTNYVEEKCIINESQRSLTLQRWSSFKRLYVLTPHSAGVSRITKN